MYVGQSWRNSKRASVALAAEKRGVWEERRSRGKWAARTRKALSAIVKTFFYLEWDGEALKGFGKRGVRNWFVLHMISQYVQNRWNMLKTKFSLFPSKPPTFLASPSSDSSMLKTPVIFCISKPVVTKPCQFSVWNVSCICLLYPFPLSKPYYDLTDLLTFYFSAHHFYHSVLSQQSS